MTDVNARTPLSEELYGLTERPLSTQSSGLVGSALVHATHPGLTHEGPLAQRWKHGKACTRQEEPLARYPANPYSIIVLLTYAAKGSEFD